MRRLLLAGIVVTVLLVAFAGSALADGPYGYTGYNNGYGWGYSGYGGYGGYSQYQTRYPSYNYNCCSYVSWYNYWCYPPKTTYRPPKVYRDGYTNYNMYNTYGGYGGYGGY